MSEPFRFRDLPGEIRNKIYAMLLCTFEPPDLSTEEIECHQAEISYLRHSIQPQILRTCRAVYDEATYVMRKTNCFIKVIVSIQWENIQHLLTLKRVPILMVDHKRVKDFKDCVMSHEMTSTRRFKPRTFMILRRDLDLFCEGLAEYKEAMSRLDELVSHVVTLLDPYGSQNLSDLPEFYTLKLQESLIAPYRTLRGFPRFTIKGVIPEDLSRVAVREIARSPDMDPDYVITELEALKAKGNNFFRNGDGTMASELWAVALLKIQKLMPGRTGEKLRKAGGMNFIHRITSLKFDLSSNITQHILTMMRECAQDEGRDSLSQFEENFSMAIEWAKDPEIPGSTWEASPQQVAKLYYREAVGCRLLGQLDSAQRAIDVALNHLPGDIGIKNEKERIIRARTYA